MDGAAQRMRESRTRRATPGVFAGILIALAVCTLPMCDACSEAEMANAFAGAGLSSSGGTASALGPCVLWAALAIAIVFGIAKAFAARVALPIVAAGVLVGGWMVWSSSEKIARTRSSAVDSWPSCNESDWETGGYRMHSSFGGPHLPSGRACVDESEGRRAHQREHPDGDLGDGIHQILYRFPKDRPRVLYIPAALLLGLVCAFVLAFVANRRFRQQPP